MRGLGAIGLALFMAIAVPAHAGKAGDIMAKHGFSKAVQDIADEIYDSIRDDLKNAGFAARFLDLIDSPHTICKLGVTVLTREMVYVLVHHLRSEETALVYRRYRKMLELLGKECAERNAKINVVDLEKGKLEEELAESSPFIADFIGAGSDKDDEKDDGKDDKKDDGAGKPGESSEPKDDAGDASDDDESIRSDPRFKDWNIQNLICVTNCQKFHDAYVAHVDYYNIYTENLEKLFLDVAAKRGQADAIAAELAALTSAHAALTDPKDRLANEAKTTAARRQLDSKEQEIAELLARIDAERKSATDELAKSQAAWEALLDCLKTQNKKSVTYTGCPTDLAFEYFGPYRHDPVPGRKQEYDELMKELSRSGDIEVGMSGHSQSESSALATAAPAAVFGPNVVASTMNLSPRTASLGSTGLTAVVDVTLSLPASSLDATGPAYVNVLVDLNGNGIFDREPFGEHVLVNYFVDYLPDSGDRVLLPGFPLRLGETPVDRALSTVIVSAQPLDPSDPFGLGASTATTLDVELVFPWDGATPAAIVTMQCPPRMDFAGTDAVQMVCTLSLTGSAARDVHYVIERVHGDTLLDGGDRIAETLRMQPGADGQITIPFWATPGIDAQSVWTFRASSPTVGAPETSINATVHIHDSVGDIQFVDSVLSAIGTIQPVAGALEASDTTQLLLENSVKPLGMMPSSFEVAH